ncbi:MAG: aliphatic sulfonates ABC transporter substrate-binding protein [Pseudanabaena frigida]|uniref:Putative aliphatic sulfonates-binding protein n=1 Tax=Pseudanabaena frigida TaxID=945775 RepID=A0A2W4W3H8_9CYAN|nr:MAG: aliphatic sulfonates ABC transporter substrate-binding protein [Pseudanabaena frigida]
MKELPPLFKVFTRPDQVQKIKRRSLLFSAAYGLIVATTLISCSGAPTNTATNSPDNKSVATNSPNSGEKKVIRVVRSKQLGGLAVLEKKELLAKALQPLGYEVKWAEFAAGPQALEALNAKGLDIAYTAESPPVFYQAAGNELIFIGATASNGKGISLLVPKDSPVKSIQDLKGKKIAFQKASIGHYLAVRAFENAGLTINDFESVFLPPPDAAAAFSQGSLAGWFVWDPFVPRTEASGAGRVLFDGEKLRDTRNFISTRRDYYTDNKEAIKIFLSEYEKAEKWIQDNPKEAAELLTDVSKIDVPTLLKMHPKYQYGLRPFSQEIIDEQERVADFWFRLKLIPKRPDVKKGFLTPEEYASFTPSEVLALAKKP